MNALVKEHEAKTESWGLPALEKGASARGSILPKLPAVARLGLIVTITTTIWLAGFFDSSSSPKKKFYQFVATLGCSWLR